MTPLTSAAVKDEQAEDRGRDKPMAARANGRRTGGDGLLDVGTSAGHDGQKCASRG